LLRLGDTRADTAGVAHAFAASGAPLQILDIPDERPREIYGYDLLLLRPDMHVAWRGNTPPEDAENLARMVTGNWPRRGSPGPDRRPSAGGAGSVALVRSGASLPREPRHVRR
jgi:hypothetical protein